MRVGRDRFRKLVERQLDLFSADEAELLAEADEAEEVWNRADREGAEDAYGDYQLVVDAVADRLLAVRDAYAATLDDGAAEAYRESFNRHAGRRFRRHPTVGADLNAT